MDWLAKIKSIVPFRHDVLKKYFTFCFKINVLDFEPCRPRGVTRERSLGRVDKLDIIHVFPDGRVRHTPIQ